MKRINVRLLVILMITGIVGLGGTYFLHGFQAKRRADGLLVRAEEKKEQQDYEAAVKMLFNYLKRRPDDRDQYGNLALTMKKMLEVNREQGKTIDNKTWVQTYQIIEEALRKNPDEITLREAAIEFSMDPFRRWTDAISHLKYLIAAQGESADPNLKVKLATCYSRSGQEQEARALLSRITGYDEVARAFDPASAESPDSANAYMLLATIYRNNLSNPDEARRIVDQMVDANPGRWEPLMRRAVYVRYIQDDEPNEEATNDIKNALKIAPDEEDVLMAAGQMATDDRKLDWAEKIYRHFAEKHPGNVAALRGLSIWARMKGDFDQSIEYLQQGLERDPRNAELIWQRANIELETGKYEQLGKTIEQLRKLHWPRPFLEFLRGREHLAKGEWQQASLKLSEARPHIEQFRPHWLTALDGNLAVCYERLRQSDQLMKTCERILERDPTNIQARWSKTQALKSLRRNTKMLEEYAILEQQLKANPDYANRLLAPWLGLETMQQLALPMERRDWSDAELLASKIIQADNITITAKAKVVSDYLERKGEPERAKRLMAQALKQTSGSLGLKFASIQKTERDKGFEAALKELDRVQLEVGDILPVRMLKADIVARNRPADVMAQLTALENDLDKFDSDQTTTLLAQLGRYYLAIPDYDAAERVWQQIADLEPNNINIRIGIFEVALRRKDEARLADALKQLQALVGRESAESKWAQATIILWQVSEKKKPISTLETASGLIDEAISDREAWERLYRVRGEIEFTKGNIAGAREALETAVELGTNNVDVFRRLARIYHGSEQYDLAEEMLANVPEQLYTRVEQRIAMEIKSRRNELPTELPVNEDSQDPSDHLFAGNLLANAKRFDEAEIWYRKATTIAPAMPEAWGALFRLYINSKDLEKAKSVIEEAKQNLVEEEAPMFLGTAHRVLQNWDLAEKNYKAALEIEPENSKIMFALADLYLVSKQYVKARATLERMASLSKPYQKNPDGRVAWARRKLAELTASSGSFEDFRKALKIIEQNVPEGQQLSGEDLLVWAQMCGRRRDTESREKAIERLEQVQLSRKLTDNESIVLAQLYESVDRWSDCRTMMVDLLADNPSNMVLLEPWLNWLIKHDNLDDAAVWVDSCDPKSIAAVRTRAQIDARRGRADEAARRLRGALPQDLRKSEPKNLAVIAAIIEELGEYDDRMYRAADKLWRTYAELAPNDALKLAGFLQRRHTAESSKEALEICGRALDSGNVAAGLSATVTLFRFNGHLLDDNSEQMARSWFDDAIQAHPQDAYMLIQRSEFEDMTGNLDDAEAWLRKFLDSSYATEPQQRAMVANNLAFKLAVRGEKEESFRLAQQALTVFGPTGDVHDTMGLVFLARSEISKAVEELRAAVADKPVGSIYLHLAIAEWQAGNKDGALDAFQKAIEFGFDPKEATTFDKQTHENLKEDLTRDGLLDPNADREARLQSPNRIAA